MFKESFLHFIWQYQYFNTNTLQDTKGQSIEIDFAGLHNLHEGPDFKEAKINIADLDWYGSVEIHRYASDWRHHGHENDPNYENVILHVVWENDEPLFNKYGQEVPTLELKGKIKPGVIKRYKEITGSNAPIPCANVLKNVRSITKLGMLERTLTSRLEAKSEAVLELLKKNNRDWEETAYVWLASGFGFKSNTEAFRQLAMKVPLRVLSKHRGNSTQIEALLFGQAGLLEEAFADEYLKELYKEHDFLKTKYQLKSPLLRAAWTFARVRPANFPPIRISQLAAVLSAHPNLFSAFTEASSLQDFAKIFSVRQSKYWTTHYDLSKPSKKKIGHISKSSIENLMMNVTVPLLVALWRDRSDDLFFQKAQNLLMSLKAEENTITNKWRELGWNVSNAFDSQGLIHLHNNYCKRKRCVECSIGVELIGKSRDTMY